MAYSPKQLTQAIILAQQIVELEERKSSLDLTIPGSQELYDQKMASLQGNELAKKLLPQARSIVKMRTARREAVNKLVIGKLVDAMVNATRMNNLSPDLATFSEQLDQEQWIRLCGAINKGNPLEVCDALSSMLTCAVEDIVESELPPVPPAYQPPKD